MQAPGQGRGRTDFRFALAMATIAVGTVGAIAGSAIGATAMTYDSSYAYEMPQRASLSAFVDGRTGAEGLPDHYAMETPDGVVEVAELRTRGLYANARYAHQGYVFPETSEWYPASFEADPDHDVAVEVEQQSMEPVASADESTGVTIFRGTTRSVATVSVSAAQQATTTPLEPLFQGG